MSEFQGGFVIIDKPAGITSAGIVGDVKWKVKKIFGKVKVGHAGTLDPLATGVLPIAIGKATKKIHLFREDSKNYSFGVVFGEKMDTDDIEGKVLKSCDKIPSRNEILGVLDEFRGEISQRPPIFSAIKIDGKRAYDLAREGKITEEDMQERPVNIFKFDLVSLKENEAEFVVKCSKGTYVRSLARDIAERLGSFGHVNKLRRLAVGDFGESKAIGLAEFKDLDEEGVKRVLFDIG